MVFANGSDPVADGLVASMNRPGGNITGVTSIAAAIVPKRLELLRELVPNISTVAVLINPKNPLSVAERESTEVAARSVGQRLEVFRASTSSEVDLAFAQLRERRVGGLIITTDLFYFGHLKRFAELAIQYKMPTIAPLKEFAAGGGLISYGASIPDAYRQAGVYSGRVLKGEKPEDLPILQPTKFDYVINLSTAKALGLEIPPMLLARADEVIE
jgi:putative ABC transport system substrate-binding protein